MISRLSGPSRKNVGRQRELNHNKCVIGTMPRPSSGHTVTMGECLPRYGLAVQATILVAEDEVLVRMNIADQLRGAGYKVLEASNANEALDLLRGHPVRLLFSDIRMPGTMDGVGLARAIRSQYPEIKVLLTSAESFSASHWADNDGFFPKPYDAKRIIEYIKTLLG
jgi:CheY-like chemotaxis protein